MSERSREDLIRRAVRRHFVEWSYPDFDKSALCLGAAFEQSVKKLLKSVTVERGAIEAVLETFPNADLELAAGLNGAGLSSLLEARLTEVCKEVRGRLPRYGRYELIAIGAYPDELADFDYWSNLDRFSLEEFVWLSIGLEPEKDLSHYLDKVPPARRTQNAYVRKEAMRRRALFVSAQGLDPMQKAIHAEQAHEWLQTVSLDVPDGFRNALHTAWLRLKPKAVDAQEFVPNTQNPSPIEIDDDRKPEPRELRSMAKVLTAIAIEEYGYDPKAARSPIPNEIESICDQNGLSVSKDTIRKYLRLGAKLRDGD